MKNGRRDVTIKVHQILDMCRKANFFDGKTTDLKQEEIIFLIEKYYDPSTTLQSKLTKEKFQEYVKANPQLITASMEVSAKKL